MPSYQPRSVRKLIRSLAWRQVALAAVVFTVIGALAAYAQAPPAGGTIGNQATFTFDDGSGTTRTVTSNLVQTIVQQVASLTLTADGATTAAPGNQVAFPHTLTNTGNGTDTFTLNLVNDAGDNFDFTGFAIYRDADQNGVPDDFSDLNGTTVALNAGEAFHFVVVGTVPGTTPDSQAGNMSVTATSVFDAGQTATNTDIANVTGNAVVNVTKAIDVTNGPAGSGPYTYTLTYTNAGNATALNVTLSDLIPTGMTYVPNSGRWSVTIAAVLTDADAGDAQGTAPDTIVYDFNVTTANTMTAVLNQVEAGESGTLTFQVTVDGSAVPGIINNTAVITYDDGSGTIIGPQNTNTVPFTVDPTRGVDVTDVGSTTDNDGDNDIVNVATAPQGSTVAFENVIINNGNDTDTFNITFSGSTFPGVTAFQLFQADGATPLVDTNSDSIPDTGPVPAGATVRVVLKAILDPAESGAGPFDITKTATSINDPTVTDSTIDRLDAILGDNVDLTNDVSVVGGAGAGDGLGAGPEVAAVQTNTNVSTGTTTTFNLFVNNVGPTADAYDLAASTDSSFAAITLPTGWTVQFFLDDGSGSRDAGDTLIANSGSIPAGGDVLVFADVSIPAGYTAGTVDIYFRALSPTSGVSDIIRDAVEVATERSITLNPDNVGQVFPGSVVVYQHTMANEGNVDEGAAFSTVTLDVTNSQQGNGFNTVVYYDSNGNGVIDVGTDPVVSTNGTPTAFPVAIPAGTSVTLLTRVTAPPAAVVGTVDVATITATTTGNINGIAPPPVVSVTDTSTVISGDISLTKTQALDADCDDTADTAYGSANITANPGECICYQVTATNTGTANTTNAVFNDTTPVFTTLSLLPSVTVGTVTTDPGIGGNGPIEADVGTLTPLQSSILSFCVQIDQ